MSIWQKITSTVKKWLGGGSSKSKSTKATPPKTRVTYSNPQSRNQTQVSRGRSRVVVDVDDKKEKERLANTFKAKSREYADTAAAMKKPKASSQSNAKSDTKKATPPAVKHHSTAMGTLSTKEENRLVARKAKAETDKTMRKYQAAKLEPLINEKYSSRKSGAPAYVKQGNYAADPLVAKYNVSAHPIATTLARAGVSGTTFGTSELLKKYLTKDPEQLEAEQFYQKYKSKPAEFIGETVGGLAGFGFTGAMSKQAASRIAPNLTERLGARATEYVASKGLVQNAARREALRKFGATATEEQIKQLAQVKAAKLVAALGEDAAINITTGAVSDFSHALVDSDNPTEFLKNMGLNAAGNVVLGTIPTVAPELFRGSELEDSLSYAGREMAQALDNKQGGIKLSAGDSVPKVNKAETIASGTNWLTKEDISIWKDGGNLYVGNPNGEFKSFGADIPENRIKAEDEFDFLNNRRKQEFREAREEKQTKKKKAKSKKEEPKRPAGVRKFTKKQLEEMKRTRKLGELSKAEYDYYFPKEEVKLTFDDGADEAGKAVASNATPEEPKVNVAENKTEEPKGDGSTKTLTKKQLQNKKRRSDKRLKEIEAEIKKSPQNQIAEADKTIKELDEKIKKAQKSGASDETIASLKAERSAEVARRKDLRKQTVSQYDQEALSAKYTNELEYRKKLEAQIKEAEESSDGTITVNKGKKKGKKPVDETGVTVTKGKADFVEEPPKAEATSKEAGSKPKAQSEAAAEEAAKEPKTPKKVKSLENKIAYADENIKKFDAKIKEAEADGKSEKVIENLKAQREAEITRRNDLKDDLKELTGSSEVSAKEATPPETKAKADVEPKKSGNKKIDSYEKKVAFADENIKEFDRKIKEARKNGDSEKSIKHLEEQRAKEVARRKDLKKELKALKKDAEKQAEIKARAETEAKVAKTNEEKLYKEYEKERYSVADKSSEELEKQRADLLDDLKALSDDIDSPRERSDDELRSLEREHQLKSELYDTIDDELRSRKPAEKAVKQNSKAKKSKAEAKVTAPEKPMTKAAQTRAKKEAARQRLDVLLQSAKEKQAAYDGGDTNALKELVSIENEAKQAYRDAGMSRSDEYRTSKALFAEHEKALKKLERKGAKPAAATLKSKEENTDVLATYKRNQKESLEKIRAEEANTVTTEGKTYSAVDESPFDEASTRTKREKPKFTPNDKKKSKAEKKAGKKLNEAKGKAQKQANRFRRNPIPRGEALYKNVRKEVTGKELDEVITPPSWDDCLDAMKAYAQGQASNEKEVVSRAYNGLMNATTDDAQRDFLRSGYRDGDLHYVRIKNKEKFKEVMQRFVDEPEAVAREIVKYNNDISQLSVDRMVDMMYQSHCVMKMLRKEIDNPKLAEAERAYVKDVWSSAASLVQKLASRSGQTNQFHGVMVRMTPQKRASNAVDNIVDILDKSRGFRKKTKIEIDGVQTKLSDNPSKRRQQIRALLLENEDIAKNLEKVYKATTEDEYGEAMSELLLSTYKLNHATGFDFLQQWRYLAMLGNPKTHLRNLIGNSTFGVIRQTSNTIRSFEESLFEDYAKKHNLDIDWHGGFSLKAHAQARSRKAATDDASKAAWEWFDKHKREILGQSKYETPQMTAAFKHLAEGNTKLLGWEDDLFRAPAYREQFIKGYNKFAKKGEITNDILERIHQEALKESRIATFNEFNELAQVLAKSQSGLYDANASTGQKAVAHLSNALMPFTKVPSNILKQSINYSPAGAVKAVAHIRDAAARGDSELFNTALDELASGTTGTVIAALGYFFGKNTDIFTTNAGSQDAAAKFKKQQGVQNYSATVNLPNGKTYSITLDWLVPASCTFFMGVELAKQFQNGVSGASFTEAAGNLSQVTSRVIDPVLETSMLSGVYNIVENSRKSASYDDQKSFADIALREIVQSYLSSYVPTLQGQIARTAYDADKMVAGDGDWEYWINSMKVKMGLANTDILTDALGDDTNAYGEVKNKKKNGSDYAKSFVKNAILPANIQEVSLTDVDKQKIKEYEDYVADGGDPTDKDYLFPKKQYRKNFTYGKKGADPVDVDLTNKQVSLYNQAKTKGGAEGMRVVLEGTMFNRYDKDSDGKRTILRNGYTFEQKQKLISQFEGKSMREVEEWLYKQPQFKTATMEEQRKVLEALWSYSQNGASKGAKRVGEQAVVIDQGGDINEYNFKNELSKNKQLNLAEAIASGIVTYEEAVDFARYAGKTYYYENDEGGSSSTYYNKKQMLEYLESKGYSREKAEALFNAFKNSNAKPYGASSSRRGWGRGGWRHYGHGGGGGGSKAKALKQSDFKATKRTYKDTAAMLKTSSSRSKGLSTASPVKIEPPTVKFKKYDV